MAIVHIRVGNREYDVACDDGQEDHLRLLADEVDERVRAVMFGMGTNVGDNMALLMSALTMADDLIETKKEIANLHAHVNHLTHQLDAGTQHRQLAEMEQSMAHTIEEIAGRIEKIADQLEIQ